MFQVGVSRAVSVLRPILNSEYIENLDNVGTNPGHLSNLDIVKQMARKRKCSFIRAFKRITRNRNLGINIGHKLMPRKLKGSRKSKKKDPKSKGVYAEERSRSSVSRGVTSKPVVFAWLD